MVVLTLLLTTLLKRVEEDKMSAGNRQLPDEEAMIATVGGRARRLIEALRMMERGRVGRTLPNLGMSLNEQIQTGRQEVGTPCGWTQACEMLRPGQRGLQAWGGRGRGLSSPLTHVLGDGSRGLSLLSHTCSTSPEAIFRDDHQTPPPPNPNRVGSSARSHDPSHAPTSP